MIEGNTDTYIIQNVAALILIFNLKCNNKDIRDYQKSARLLQHISYTIIISIQNSVERHNYKDNRDKAKQS